ncbi:MAG: phosphoribosylglycinamide formyltransferase [Gammaproteobacteria bacterium]|nr:phosphoribosylglycinamide formyltransferase [Gammaproteobacteria bacterium]
MQQTDCTIAVLISGNGSNLQALIDASASSNYKVGLVISNNPAAYGLQRAAQAGIPAQVINHRDFASREAFDLELISALDAFKPQLIVLAGFMRILSPQFVQHFNGRILNIHPSLLPKYPGTNTHQRILDAGESEHGVSVHFVTEELDGGPVIAQEKVAVLDTDTAAVLAARVAQKEHLVYPRVVSWFASGRLRMQNNNAYMDATQLPACGLEQLPK